jgi:putative spermidine/putrescine transport system substrate-binding protein
MVPPKCAALSQAIPVFLAFMTCISGARADEITAASAGGAYQAAARKAFYEPTMKALGIVIKEDTTKGLTDVRLQVQGNSVKWDLVELTATECVLGSREGLFETLDYKVIDPSGIDPKLVNPNWVGFTYFSVVLIYNTDTYGANGPKNWADFWDTKKFPGRRALGRVKPDETLTIAALADGIPRDSAYPIDIDRAVASLDRIKGSITAWWTSGAQAMQLVRDGEVDMASIWSGRASALAGDGAPVKYSFDQALLGSGCMVIPKGAPHRDLAMKALAEFLKPNNQAELPLNIANGPANMKAFDTGRIPADKLPEIVSSPQNVKTQVLIDPTFWADNLTKATERFEDEIQK